MPSKCLSRKGDYLNIPRMVRGVGKNLRRRDNPPKKTIKAICGVKGKEVCGDESEVHKGKHQHFASITGGATRSSVSSKGTIKRMFSKLMAVSKKEGNASTSNIERIILRF